MDGNLIESFSCALLDDGMVYCWGTDATGIQQTVGTREDVRSPARIDVGGSAEDIVAGLGFVCVALDQGAGVRCWGLNDRGQLGGGNTQSLSDQQPYVEVPLLAPGERVSALASSPLASHACAIVEGPNLPPRARCWGANDEGQLGRGSTGQFGGVQDVVGLEGRAVSDIAVGFAHTCARASGLLACWGANRQGQLGTLDAESTPTPRQVLLRIRP